MVQDTIPLLGQDAEPGIDADVEQNILLTGVDPVMIVPEASTARRLITAPS